MTPQPTRMPAHPGLMDDTYMRSLEAECQREDGMQHLATEERKLAAYFDGSAEQDEQPDLWAALLKARHNGARLGRRLKSMRRQLISAAVLAAVGSVALVAYLEHMTRVHFWWMR